jgi:hypothetical protein
MPLRVGMSFGESFIDAEQSIFLEPVLNFYQIRLRA